MCTIRTVQQIWPRPFLPAPRPRCASCCLTMTRNRRAQCASACAAQDLRGAAALEEILAVTAVKTADLSLGYASWCQSSGSLDWQCDRGGSIARAHVLSAPRRCGLSQLFENDLGNGRSRKHVRTLVVISVARYAHSPSESHAQYQ